MMQHDGEVGSPVGYDDERPLHHIWCVIFADSEDPCFVLYHAVA